MSTGWRRPRKHIRRRLSSPDAAVSRYVSRQHEVHVEYDCVAGLVSRADTATRTSSMSRPTLSRWLVSRGIRRLSPSGARLRGAGASALSSDDRRPPGSETMTPDVPAAPPVGRGAARRDPSSAGLLCLAFRSAMDCRRLSGGLGARLPRLSAGRPFRALYPGGHHRAEQCAFTLRGQAALQRV